MGQILLRTVGIKESARKKKRGKGKSKGKENKENKPKAA